MQVKLKGRGSNRALKHQGEGRGHVEMVLDTPQTLMQRLGGSREALPQGQFYTVRIGGNRPFRNVFASPRSLVDYLKGWNPKSETKQGRQKLKRDLIAQMGIVTITQGTPNEKRNKTQARRNRP